MSLAEVEAVGAGVEAPVDAAEFVAELVVAVVGELDGGAFAAALVSAGTEGVGETAGAERERAERGEFAGVERADGRRNVAEAAKERERGGCGGERRRCGRRRPPTACRAIGPDTVKFALAD